jgi:cytochrome bd-type quinol oxidase subunit 2
MTKSRAGNWLMTFGILALVAFVSLSVWAGFYLDATGKPHDFWFDMINVLAPLGIVLAVLGAFLRSKSSVQSQQ